MLKDTPALQVEFVQVQTKLRNERKENAYQLESWAEKPKAMRKDELVDAGKERGGTSVKGLKTKVRWVPLLSYKKITYELGWGGELDVIGASEFWSLPSVDKAQRLTKKIWSNISSELYTSLEKFRPLALEKLVKTRSITLIPSLVHIYKVPQNGGWVPSTPPQLR
ncbi:hypothetical protein DXG01_008392 [Tephrocybe rancida]|nr:hypothetical protein DXG01_008392 [Tephrocybe rancida]